MSYNEFANTDLMKVYGLILKAVIDNELPKSELPKTIYVISDMKFDAGVCNNMSLHEEVKELFNKYGCKLPNIVYWNVDSRNNQYPVMEFVHLLMRNTFRCSKGSPDDNGNRMLLSGNPEVKILCGYTVLI